MKTKWGRNKNKNRRVEIYNFYTAQIESERAWRFTDDQEMLQRLQQ